MTLTIPLVERIMEEAAAYEERRSRRRSPSPTDRIDTERMRELSESVAERNERIHGSPTDRGSDERATG
jgi:hypothetical protein